MSEELTIQHICDILVKEAEAQGAVIEELSLRWKRTPEDGQAQWDDVHKGFHYSRSKSIAGMRERIQELEAALEVAGTRGTP